MNRRVIVTRDESDDGPLATALRAAGLEPVVIPVIRCIASNSARAAADLEGYDWAIWTSAAAVRTVAPAPGPAKHASVGPRTTAALAEYGVRAAIEGTRGGAELAERCALEIPAGSRVVYPRSERAGTDLTETLRNAGLSVDDPVAYRIEPLHPPDLHKEFDAGVGAVAFASPSAVEAFAENLGNDAGRVSDSLVASIGPTTTRALTARLRSPDVVAAEPTFESLADAIRRAIEQSGQEHR